MSSSPTITAKLTLVRGARRRAALVVVPLLALAWAPLATTGAALVPSGFIAVTNGSGSAQISQFTLDGVLVRRLTTGPANPTIRACHRTERSCSTRAMKGGTQEIYRRNLTAGAPAGPLTRPPLIATSPSWSPDGNSIAYSALVPGGRRIRSSSRDADGSRPVQLTHTTDSGNTQPVFSSDGSRIAYINGRETTTRGADGSSITLFANRIWVVDADGSRAAPLTPGPRDAYPQWLDSTTVLFAREDVATQTSRILSVGLDGRRSRTNRRSISISWSRDHFPTARLMAPRSKRARRCAWSVSPGPTAQP